MGVDTIGINKTNISLRIIARIIARISESQKLKQKSQLKSSEMSLGALAIISSRTPSLPISKIPNAEMHAIIITSVIKCISDIIL